MRQDERIEEIDMLLRTPMKAKRSRRLRREYARLVTERYWEVVSAEPDRRRAAVRLNRLRRKRRIARQRLERLARKVA